VDRKGLTPEQLGKLPQLQFNQLRDRLLTLLASEKANKGQRISFKEFCISLSVFAPEARRDTKLKFAFKAFDVDGDGQLGRSDMLELVRCMTPPGGTPQALKQTVLEAIVDKTLEEADQDGDGALSYDEFLKTVQGSDFHAKLSIDL